MRFAFLLLIAITAGAAPCRRAHVLIRGSDIDSNCASDERIERLAHNYHRQVFWFESAGGSYVVTDAATLDHVEAIFEPQVKLGREQAELGRRQATLGREQSQLGREQARLARRQARADIDGDASQQTAFARQQAELSRKESELARRQQEMAREQSAMARRQSELSREEEQKLESLEDDLIRSGAAHRE